MLYGAIKLFADIDINGDQHMQWAEFMQYIIDAVGSGALTIDTEAGNVMKQMENERAN